jgi:ribosomal protein S18 acetylase RimI-like enzyme
LLRIQKIEIIRIDNINTGQNKGIFMSAIDLSIRQATIDDVPSIVQILSDDPLGSKRERFETPLPESYFNAFNSINKDPYNELVVATHGSEIVGFMQITFIPYLTYQGKWRALIEGVRVSKKFRSQGIGQHLFQWAIDRSKEKGCHLIQLTTDKQRPIAIRFYESLGFKATHEGMKMHFND